MSYNQQQTAAWAPNTLPFPEKELDNQTRLYRHTSPDKTVLQALVKSPLHRVGVTIVRCPVPLRLSACALTTFRTQTTLLQVQTSNASRKQYPVKPAKRRADTTPLRNANVFAGRICERPSVESSLTCRGVSAKHHNQSINQFTCSMFFARKFTSQIHVQVFDRKRELSTNPIGGFTESNLIVTLCLRAGSRALASAVRAPLPRASNGGLLFFLGSLGSWGEKRRRGGGGKLFSFPAPYPLPPSLLPSPQLSRARPRGPESPASRLGS